MANNKEAPKEQLKPYVIPVSWDMSGTMIVYAPTLEDALIEAQHNALPTDGEYVQDSFWIDEDAARDINCDCGCCDDHN